MLSKRLLAVANMVDKDSVVADIGTDHAYLPIYLVQNKICKHAIASDVIKGPLKQAEIDIDKANLSDQIQCVLSDGLKDVDGQYDCVTIAGLGGSTITNILIEGYSKLPNTIIVQANNDINQVRDYLVHNGYSITNEVMVLEKDIIYPIVKFNKGKKIYSLEEIKYGPILLKNKDELLIKQVQSDIEHDQNILSMIPLNNHEKRDKLAKQIEFAKHVLSLIKE